MEKKSKTVRKLLPVSPFDSEGLESWFSEMAGQGLFVIKAGYYFASFRQMEAVDMEYRLEPWGLYRDAYENEITSLYRLAGWEAVGNVWRKFLIFSAERKGAIPPEVPEHLRKAGTASLKRTGRDCIFNAILDCLLVGVWFYAIVGRYGFWYAVTRMTPLFFMLLMVFMFGMGTYWQLSDYVQIRSYTKRGPGERRGRKYRKGRKRSLCLTVTVVLLGLAFLWTQELRSWHIELGEVDTALPVPPVTELYPVNRLIGGTVDYHSSIAAPVQFEIHQEGADAVILWIDYMELQYSWLVTPVLHSLMSEKLSWSKAEWEVLSTDLFDTAYQTEINETMHYFFASDGLKVISVCYIGEGYSEETLELIHDAMGIWTKPDRFKCLPTE